MQASRPLSIGDIAAMSRDNAEAEIRARVQTAYLGEETVLTRVLGFHKMFLKTTDLGFGCHVMLDGFWETWLTLFLARTVKPGMSAIDVGANFGYYSVLMGAAVGPGGRLIAIEPIPTTMALLRRTVALNGLDGWTTLVEAAVTAPGIERVDMIADAAEPKNAAITHAAGPGTVAVAATTLDALTRGLDALHVIKIDAEGAEAGIFDGMGDTLRRLKPDLVLEFNALRYRDAAAFLGRLRSAFRSMKALGFDGELQPIREDEVLRRDTGEDWLLHFSHRA